MLLTVLVSAKEVRDGLLKVGLLSLLVFTCLFCLHKELWVTHSAQVNMLLNRERVPWVVQVMKKCYFWQLVDIEFSKG